jgi:hypothetical protein
MGILLKKLNNYFLGLFFGHINFKELLDLEISKPKESSDFVLNFLSQIKETFLNINTDVFEKLAYFIVDIFENINYLQKISTSFRDADGGLHSKTQYDLKVKPQYSAFYNNFLLNFGLDAKLPLLAKPVDWSLTEPVGGYYLNKGHNFEGYVIPLK